jgi:hypothetical protein
MNNAEHNEHACKLSQETNDVSLNRERLQIDDAQRNCLQRMRKSSGRRFISCWIRLCMDQIRNLSRHQFSVLFDGELREYFLQGR